MKKSSGIEATTIGLFIGIFCGLILVGVLPLSNQRGIASNIATVAILFTTLVTPMPALLNREGPWWLRGLFGGILTGIAMGVSLVLMVNAILTQKPIF
jgi:uncharacterized membrane-anchored protein YitT (DUF2179 family)